MIPSVHQQIGAGPQKAALLLVLCSVTFAIADDAPSPVGTWEWFETENPAGVFVYPEDVGYTLLIQLGGDGLYVEFHDETIFRLGTYTFYMTEFDGTEIPTLEIVSDGVTEIWAYSTYGGTQLELWGGHNSGGYPSYPVERFIPHDPVVADSNETWDSIKSMYRD